MGEATRRHEAFAKAMGQWFAELEAACRQGLLPQHITALRGDIESATNAGAVDVAAAMQAAINREIRLKSLLNAKPTYPT